MSLQRVIRPLVRSSCLRALSTTVARLNTAYDSDGKTTVTVLNREPGLGLMVDTYSTKGFRLNNGSFVFGPIALFPKTLFSWNVDGDQDINEDSLDLFTVLEPKPDVLIVGFGGQPQFKPKLDQLLYSFRVKHRINLEILPTDRAVSTFNFLNAEGRYVMAALVPPTTIVWDDETATTRSRRKAIYETDD